jgi:mRNA interferase MazF
MRMASFSRNDVVSVRYPFTDLSSSKVRPVVVVSASHPSSDLFVVPLTSKITSLLAGEFLLTDQQAAGVRMPSAVKRGLGTLKSSLIVKRLGRLSPSDSQRLDQSLRSWLGL